MHIPTTRSNQNTVFAKDDLQINVSRLLLQERFKRCEIYWGRGEGKNKAVVLLEKLQSHSNVQMHCKAYNSSELSLSAAGYLLLQKL